MKPYVICHMTVSIDGKATGSFLEHEASGQAIEIYYDLHRKFSAQAFACGRVTMEESFTKGWQPDLNSFEHVSMTREDYCALKADFYAVAFDRKGRLGWKSSHICDEDPGYDRAHVIEVLCENVSDAYLAYLRSIHVSYVFAGKNELDLSVALKKLYDLFSIETLLLEGGSEINGAFARDGLIDELSFVQAPVVADTASKPVFENGILENYKLKHAEIINPGVLVCRYQKRKNSSIHKES